MLLLFNVEFRLILPHNINDNFMESQLENNLRLLLNSKLEILEKYLDADVLVYYGPIGNLNENVFLKLVEELAQSANHHNTLYILLTTTGGSAITVERYVNIIRHHYSEVNFIVPDYAYSAGTIFCMSGDSIFMDYFSVLVPIDPQVQNKEGKWVAALGYLDKVNEYIEKAKLGTLTNVEFAILKDFDLAELRSFEQARDLTIDLLKKWLVKYKFKNWTKHSNGTDVTIEEKKERAAKIAEHLSDNNDWRSHGRPINIEALKELKLKIEDYSENIELRIKIRDYYETMSDYVRLKGFPIFIHDRIFL